MLLFLSLYLSSCSKTVTIKEIQKQYPEAKYLRDCGDPAFNGEQAVYSELVPYIKTLQSALRQCNNDKKALRDWVDAE